jgi:hypothetical protein
VKRQKKSGSVRKAKARIEKILSRPMTKDSFAKTVEIMPDGSRTVLLTPDMVELLKEQRELFRAKFGRDPGPHDPVFFDPDADEPRSVNPLDPAVMEADALKAGVRPEIAFAIAKTGVFLMKENEHLYPDEDKEAFCAAVQEYRERASKLDS